MKQNIDMIRAALLSRPGASPWSRSVTGFTVLIERVARATSVALRGRRALAGRGG